MLNLIRSWSDLVWWSTNLYELMNIFLYTYLLNLLPSFFFSTIVEYGRSMGRACSDPRPIRIESQAKVSVGSTSKEPGGKTRRSIGGISARQNQSLCILSVLQTSGKKNTSSVQGPMTHMSWRWVLVHRPNQGMAEVIRCHTGRYAPVTKVYWRKSFSWALFGMS